MPVGSESSAPGARRWTAAGVAERAFELLRAGSVRPLVFGVLGETVYRRLVVLERELDVTAPPVDEPGLEFGFLGPDRISEYEALRPGHSGRAQERLTEGHRCFAARVEGDLASVRWVAVGGAHVEYLDLRLALAPGEVFSYDAFTAPGYRRRGISTATQNRLAEVLHAEGHRRVIRAVLPENRAGFRDALTVGFRPNGRIGYVRLGPWRRELRRRRRARSTASP